MPHTISKTHRALALRLLDRSGSILEIEMKLTSGSTNILRAQDLADVIGLIRQHGLTSEFARQLRKSARQAYRQLRGPSILRVTLWFD